MPPRIVVPQPIRPEGIEILARAGEVEVIEVDRMLSRDEIAAALRRADYLLAIGDLPLDAELLGANPDLRGISVAALHADEWMDVDAATALGIPVAYLRTEPGSLGPVALTTAELTIALIMGLAWRLVEADHWTRCGKFRQEQTTSFTCTRVTGKTLGLVGLGKVGRIVAERAPALGLRTLYTKPNRLDEDDERALSVEWVESLDDLIRRSDFLSLQASYGPDTHMMIGARELALMKPTAFLINTARGRIVDEDALIAALSAGRIAGAGLDVYVGEPPVVPTPDPDPRFFKLDNVILTPHIGGQAAESLTELATGAATNLVGLIDGDPSVPLANPEVLERVA